MNTMILCGKLWKDAETKTLGGYSYDSFSLPLMRGTKQEDGTWRKTPFVQVLRRQGDKGAHPLLKKGAAVVAVGSLTVRAWVGDNGQPGLDLNLWCSNLNFIGMTADRQEDGSGPQDAPATADGPDNDLPF